MKALPTPDLRCKAANFLTNPCNLPEAAKENISMTKHAL